MTVHPLTLLVGLITAVALVLMPRQRLVAPFFLAAVFVPTSQGFDVVGLDITLARALIIVVWLRFLVRGEFVVDRLNAMDRTFLLWCVVGAIAYVLLWGTSAAFVNRVGQVVNYVGTYFLVRISIRDTSDVTHLTKYMRFAAIVLGIAMVVEWMTSRNVFAIFGGVSEITLIRDGRLRCQGPFGHPILAGLFAASLAPVFVGSILSGIRPVASFVALVASLLVVATTSSSGPVLGLAAGLAAWGFWPLRQHMRLVSWGAVASLVSLHMVMKAPVWALIGRVRVFGASTGWHRYNLFNQFLVRANEWWLVGTRSTAHWGYSLDDVANNYVRIGVNGGVFTLLVFLLLLRRCFTSLGRALRLSKDRGEMLLLWSLGASLTVHVVGSFGVSYWDQIIFLFALLLGIVSAASEAVLSRQSTAVGERVPSMLVGHPVAATPLQGTDTPSSREIFSRPVFMTARPTREG